MYVSGLDSVCGEWGGIVVHAYMHVVVWVCGCVVVCGGGSSVWQVVAATNLIKQTCFYSFHQNFSKSIAMQWPTQHSGEVSWSWKHLSTFCRRPSSYTLPMRPTFSWATNSEANPFIYRTISSTQYHLRPHTCCYTYTLLLLHTTLHFYFHDTLSHTHAHPLPHITRTRTRTHYSIPHPHTATPTHVQRERERERGREIVILVLESFFLTLVGLLLIRYHKHYYALGEHYNSIVPQEEQEEEEEED